MKTEQYIQHFPFSVKRWTDWWTHKQNFWTSFLPTHKIVKTNVSTNFGKGILKTDQNITHFHLSVNKWTNWRTHTKNSYFGLTNLWHRSKGRCPTILVKITWKLRNFSNFLSQNIPLFNVSVNKWTNWQTHKQKFEI